jgi:hypothetical protein
MARRPERTKEQRGMGQPLSGWARKQPTRIVPGLRNPGRHSITATTREPRQRFQTGKKTFQASYPILQTRGHASALTRNQCLETLPSSIHGLVRTKQHPVRLKSKKPAGKQETLQKDSRLGSTTSIKGRRPASIDSARDDAPYLAGQTNTQDKHYRPGKSEVTMPQNSSQNKNVRFLYEGLNNG